MNQPNTSASRPGAARHITAANGKLWKPCQYQGSLCQSRKTMKSGSSLR